MNLSNLEVSIDHLIKTHSKDTTEQKPTGKNIVTNFEKLVFALSPNSSISGHLNCESDSSDSDCEIMAPLISSVLQSFSKVSAFGLKIPTNSSTQKLDLMVSLSGICIEKKSCVEVEPSVVMNSTAMLTP